MRICFISHSAYMGGAERALLEAIRSLMNRGVTCHVLLPHEGLMGDELAKMKVPFRIIKYQPWVYKDNISWWLRTRYLLISLLMVVPTSMAIIRWKSTIVYTNTTTIFTGALAAFITRRPHIWHIHEFGYQDHGLRFILGNKISWFLLDHLSAICITASNALADMYRGIISPSKLKVIYQSVTISSSTISAQNETSEFKCMIVGKISEGKNQEEAINAVAELKKRGIRVVLCIIGDGFQDYISHLNEIVQEKGLKNEVDFIGYSKDAFSYMREAGVILMCSRCEGFGRVTVEGMLAGKPIIGARSGATTELVQDGITGLLYTAGNYIDLSHKIEYIYKNATKSRHMGENARAWALERFSEERYGDDLMQLLLNIASPGVKNGDSQIKEDSNS